MVLEELLGETLLKNDATEIKTSELSTEKGAVVGLYFSAHWCPPCRQFTPKLASVYNEIKAKAGNNFEMVFISWDGDDDSFKSYHTEMPWLAIPFDNQEKKDACSEKYKVEGIPSLVLLDAATGDTIKAEGRSAIDTYGADGFPYTEERLASCKSEREEKKATALKDLASFSFVEPITMLGDDETKLDIKSIMDSCETVAFTFLKGRGCQGSKVVLPKMISVQEELGKEKLGVVVIALEEMDKFEDESKEKLKLLPIVQFKEDETDETSIVKKFESILLEELDPPQVFVVSSGTGGEPVKIHADNAARNIYFVGAEAYPWSEEALAAKKAKEEALKVQLKLRVENLEIFSEGEVNGTDYTSHLADKDCATVGVSELHSKQVVGIYFSAHWCGPCRRFTPQLVELYNKCKEQGKSFEVVFVSSDRDKAAFDEYYADMPWLHLRYEKRALQTAISENFGVEGIPTLVLLTGKGEMITDSGRVAVDIGEEYFPWSKEDIERGKAAAPDKEAKDVAEKKEDESKVYREQEEANKIVIRRRMGAITDLEISADHVVQFQTFSTVAASDAVVPSGKRAWYEVTFKEGSGISQIGWATNEFKSSDEYSGDGVGDCAHSYGFDGQRESKWHSGSTTWGKKFDPNGDHVLGIAADLVDGKIIFGVDGDWGEPMGVAFEDVDKDVGLFPAITASDAKVFVNFGGSDMKYGPPEPSFEKLRDIVFPSVN